MSVILISRFKDERHILFEWIHHHLEEGIDKFILIDDDSKDDYLATNDWLNDYIDNGTVEIHPSKFKQFNDYDRFLSQIKEYTWVVQIDLDEFIFSPSANLSLKDLLATKFQNSDYLRIFWKMFAHVGYHQPKSVIEDNLMTHQENKDPSSPMGIKCVAQTRFLTNVKIHRCYFSKEVETEYLESHNSDIQINHYRTQSDELLYGVKQGRGGGMHKDSFSDKKLAGKAGFKYSKKDLLLCNKRQALIKLCNNREQIRPKIYEDANWPR